MEQSGLQFHARSKDAAEKTGIREKAVNLSHSSVLRFQPAPTTVFLMRHSLPCLLKRGNRTVALPQSLALRALPLRIIESSADNM